MQVEPGDVITVRGRPSWHRWSAMVVEVNPRSGKLGVPRSEAEVARAEQRSKAAAVFSFHTGMHVSSPVRRLRWLDPACVTKVERDGQVVWQEGR